MPLKKGYSPKSIAHNIKELTKAGHSREQAIAAALRTADEAKKRKGPKTDGRR